MKSKGIGSLTGTGAAALAVILIVLTMSCFAVLTFLSSDSEYQMSRKSQAAVDSYYQTDAEASEIMEDISISLKKENFRDFISKKGYNVTTDHGDYIVSFQVPAENSQVLHVKAVFSSTGKAEILQWQMQNRK